jgi:anthranilate phosphoribosyltransferase
MTIRDAIRRVSRGVDLGDAQAQAVAESIIAGQATTVQIAALLVALHMKGETADEILGFARALRSRATRVPVSSDGLVDTCGTGGDGRGTFNVSTVAAIVAAAAGCRVAKHGNRAVSSSSGSADVLRALGVNTELSPEQAAACLDQTGFAFLMAPLYHPGVRHAAEARQEIGIRSIFNILGPLVNPAGVRRQVLGVFAPELLEMLAEVLRRLGAEHCLMVHGEDGLDEITISGRTRISELKDGSVRTYTIDAASYGVSRETAQLVSASDAQQSAEIARNVLSGQRGAARDMVLLNAGAVMYVADRAKDIAEGVKAAGEAIDSGAAMDRLEALRRFPGSARP